MENEGFVDNCVAPLIGFAIIVGVIYFLVSVYSRPDLQKAKDYIEANELFIEFYKNQGLLTPNRTKVCIDKSIVESKFYLKTEQEFLYIGNGKFWQVHIARDSLKVANKPSDFDKCSVLTIQ